MNAKRSNAPLSGVVRVPSVWRMSKADFVRHMELRHSTVYVTRNEHDQNHRLSPASDHRH